jgi:hypothetical protein
MGCGPRIGEDFLMVKRRQLLLGGAAIAVCAGLFGLGETVLKSEMAAAVRKRLGFLRLDEAGLAAFANDQVKALMAKRPSWQRIKLHFDTLFARSAAARFGYSSDRRSRLERQEDNLATLYLLSSDFFQHGADESRIVRYVALFDPLRACDNPFARPPPGSALSSRETSQNRVDLVHYHARGRDDSRNSRRGTLA